MWTASSRSGCVCRRSHAGGKSIAPFGKRSASRRIGDSIARIRSCHGRRASSPVTSSSPSARPHSRKPYSWPPMTPKCSYSTRIWAPSKRPKDAPSASSLRARFRRSSSTLEVGSPISRRRWSRLRRAVSRSCGQKTAPQSLPICRYGRPQVASTSSSLREPRAGK